MYYEWTTCDMPDHFYFIEWFKACYIVINGKKIIKNLKKKNLKDVNIWLLKILTINFTQQRKCIQLSILSIYSSLHIVR